MWSSPVLLSMSSVFVVFGTAMVIVAGVCDNWLNYKVDRKAIAESRDVVNKLGDAFIRNPVYFSRSYGLYHICFPGNVPIESGSFSFLGNTCIDNPDLSVDAAVYERYTTNQKQRWYFILFTIVAYAVGVLCLVACFLTGVVGCWSRRTKVIKTTACLVALGLLFVMIAVALFHMTIYWEMHILKMAPFQASWDTNLRQSTESSYGWAYYLFFVGSGFLLLAIVCFLFAVRAINNEKDEMFDVKQHAFMQYMNQDKAMMPYAYAPYGNVNTFYPNNYYAQYPTMNSNSYYGYMSYGH